MALIKCYECSENISSEAIVCPKCGAKPKPKKKTSLLAWLFAAVVGATVLNSVGHTLSLLFSGGGSQQQASKKLSAECLASFKSASQVDALHDKNEDLFPAFSTCKSIDEWLEANARYPGAIGSVDPIVYAKNACASYQDQLTNTAICNVAK